MEFDEPEGSVLDPVLWIQMAVDHPGVGNLGSLTSWATDKGFSQLELNHMAELSRRLNAGAGDISGYGELETRLVEAGFEARALRLVDGLLENPGIAAVGLALRPYVPAATDEVLADLCKHLFRGAELGLTGENYLGWARLAGGTGTVDDARYILHELHELQAIRQDGYQPQPRGTKIDPEKWELVYEVHHAAANKVECEFLAKQLRAFTGGEVTLSAQELAAADPVRAEGRETYFGDTAAEQHQKTKDITVQLSTPVRQKLHLATASPTRAQVIAAFKALPLTALTS